MFFYKKIVFTFLTLIFVTSLWAQQGLTESDLLLTPGELIEEELIGKKNSVLIQQVGNENDLVIDQIREIDASNLTRVLQSGNYNLINIVQAGGNNQVAVIQSGNDNLYQLDLSGTNNGVGVIQNGDNNAIIQKLLNADDISVEFLQQGNGNEIEHVVEGLTSKDYKIYQVGDGMKVIVTQTPITITN